MKVICPKCNKENNIVVSGGTECCHCSKPLDKYKFTRKLIPAVLLVAMGVGGERVKDYIMEPNRYPTKIEYALVDQCLSSDSTPMSRVSYKQKRDICIELIGKVQKEYSFSEYKKAPDEFMGLFRNYLEGF